MLEIKNFYANPVDRLAAKGRLKAAVYNKDIVKYIQGLIWSHGIMRLAEDIKMSKDKRNISFVLPFENHRYYVTFDYKTKEGTYVKVL